eukprot:SAG11_NODE_5305_length_1600_cov_2.918721_1_plen_40_part_10
MPTSDDNRLRLATGDAAATPLVQAVRLRCALRRAAPELEG